jgi:hypothetical protein
VAAAFMRELSIALAFRLSSTVVIVEEQDYMMKPRSLWRWNINVAAVTQ